MPYPCSHFYFDIRFGNRLYSNKKKRAWPVFPIQSVAKFDIKVKVTTWIGHYYLKKLHVLDFRKTSGIGPINPNPKRKEKVRKN